MTTTTQPQDAMNYQLLLSDATRDDDYVNATKLCKQFGKEWFEFSRKAQTKRLVEKLKSTGKTPVEKPNRRESLICPELAIALAEWLSPEFHLYVLSVFKAYVTADVSLATNIIKRSKDVNAVKRHTSESATQAKYLESYHGVHDQLKEHGCTGLHHAAYNKNVNKLVNVVDGRREDMDRVQRLAMHLAQAAGELALLYDEEDTREWKAVKKATRAGHKALTSVLN